MRCLKLPPLLALAVALTLGAGCSSLDSPFAEVPLLRTGNDARVFNAQTGQYEWPDGSTSRSRPTPAAARPVSRAPEPPSAPAGDGRTFDPVKGQFTAPPSGS